MTTRKRSTVAATRPDSYRFPDIPEPPDRNPEDMTSFTHLAKTGIIEPLMLHFGNPPDLLIEGERFIAALPNLPAGERRFPDLLIAFNANPDLYKSNNGYVVSAQGKAPEFVLEIASPTTRENDNGEKRRFYASLGVLEYWRFDEEDSQASVKLAGERLENGEYTPLEVVPLEGGVLEGYSPALNLCLRWEQGTLQWYDPEGQAYIATAAVEREYRQAAEARADQERQQRQAAEARVRELESEIRQLRGEG